MVVKNVGPYTVNRAMGVLDPQTHLAVVIVSSCESKSEISEFLEIHLFTEFT